MFQKDDRIIVTDNTEDEEYFNVGDIGTACEDENTKDNIIQVQFDKPKRLDGLWWAQISGIRKLKLNENGKEESINENRNIKKKK